MNSEFDAVHNYNERLIFQMISDSADRYPALSNPELLADVACVALNRMPPRYVCHDVDMSSYMSSADRAKSEAAMTVAVEFAFGFVQLRIASGTRA
jgi:late competence development protein ComFB